MGIVNHEFKTESEAEAFKQGVEWVNDSSISVVEIKHDEKAKELPWIVVCEDGESGG